MIAIQGDLFNETLVNPDYMAVRTLNSTYITQTIWKGSNVLSYGIDKTNETEKDWVLYFNGKII